MLLKTHIATSMSLALIIDSWIASHSPEYSKLYIPRLVILISTWLIQVIIDSIGHTWKTYGKLRYPARNRWHSLPFLIGLGLLLGVPTGLLLDNYYVILIFLAVVLLHWFEDLFTESGVYVYTKRVRLPFRVTYDNQLVNRGTVLVFMLLVLKYGGMFTSKFLFMENLIVLTYDTYALLSD